MILHPTCRPSTVRDAPDWATIRRVVVAARCEKLRYAAPFDVVQCRKMARAMRDMVQERRTTQFLDRINGLFAPG